ncbi:acetyltransferase [Paracidovorax wautersii]|uniref:Sugar O-acyltransferase, sialic acid O-acetyltransferase NeuD family n=1 Tax=Paracidovorax wautersii TaxID=1177982 RepID=A0A1I2CJE6_9BURK|nr:acetyltransferase [Paracidovorax wautersii]SFE68384.1 sugar O-acyltransferase, sialic acid O-acetyltransferase NeuD family [Paracidovorax wautersii]
MTKIRLLVIGAGGHGRSVAEAAHLSGMFDVIGFLDDALPARYPMLGAAVLGSIASVSSHRSRFDQVMVAIGANPVREKVMQQLTAGGFAFATVIHPRAFLAPSALLGTGSAVMAGAVIGTEAQLGKGTIVNCGAVVDHHAVVKDYGHLGVNASMAGGSVLGKGAWMQAGSALGYGVTISAGTTLRPGEAIDTTNDEYKQ